MGQSDRTQLDRTTCLRRAKQRFSLLARLSLLILTNVSLSACGGVGHKVAHRGLSPDGYGFVDNDPIVPPPSSLLRPGKSPLPQTTIPGAAPALPHTSASQKSKAHGKVKDSFPDNSTVSASDGLSAKQ